ncbi:MAG TPA: ATP-binding protein [Chloroflexota bacterium]|jgi:anti-sigma regulatory factor (Ser/Thr protein kinase)|nr:ATP-binding protein [Chloroflexota bacterium]
MARQGNASDRLLTEFTIPSQPGNERIAMRRVAEAVRPLAFESDRLARLATAVSEATMNAMEHGNHFEPERPVSVRVVASDTEVLITVSDWGGGSPIHTSAAPDLEAKLAGRQSPRGWGLFLMRQMVDDVTDESDDGGHRVHLRLRLPGQ